LPDRYFLRCITTLLVEDVKYCIAIRIFIKYSQKFEGTSIMDIDNFHLSSSFYRWSLSIALSMMVMAFVLAFAYPAQSTQPCLNLSAHSQTAQIETNLR